MAVTLESEWQKLHDNSITAARAPTPRRCGQTAEAAGREDSDYSAAFYGFMKRKKAEM